MGGVCVCVKLYVDNFSFAGTDVKKKKCCPVNSVKNDLVEQ